MNVSAHACKSTLIKYNVHGTLKTHVGPGRHSKLHCIVCDMASQLGDTVYTCVHVSLYECQCTCTWHFKNSHWGQADIPTYTASISATLHHSTNRCMQAATCTCIITRGPIKNKVDHQFKFCEKKEPIFPIIHQNYRCFLLSACSRRSLSQECSCAPNKLCNLCPIHGQGGRGQSSVPAPPIGAPHSSHHHHRKHVKNCLVM